MNGYFHSVDAAALLNPQVRKMAEKLATVWEESTNKNLGDVIMVDWGTWLEQRDYTDATGWYLKFRLCPAFAHLLSVKERGRQVLQAFKKLFPDAKQFFVEGEDAVYDGTTDTVTLVAHTDTHSIGD